MKWLLPAFFLLVSTIAFSQINGRIDPATTDSTKLEPGKQPLPAEDLSRQYDVADLFRNIFNPSKKADPTKKGTGITVVPNIAANPTIGFQGGIKAVAGRRLGNDPATLFSVAATSASITTKGIIYFYVSHNVFTSGNKWNLQGNFVIAKTVSPDFGLGIGKYYDGGEGPDSVLADPSRKVYPIRSYYFNFREKVYKNVARNLFVGAGLAFEIRRSITNRDTTNNATPSSVYNNRHGFPQDHYASNGFLFNIQYITRDNPNRAYKGVYFDVGLRINQQWIGSTRNAVQVTSDFRKYVSLSARNPEFVVSFWNWGSYLVDGNIPYLELPGTGKDGTTRSGRGYTTQYFKGTQFNDSEVELRFPILGNKFVSGVAFASLQSGNDEHGTKLFQVFQPGYGGGLRILFNKKTRTNLALDYAFGNFGNKGFFLNLNEAF